MYNELWSYSKCGWNLSKDFYHLRHEGTTGTEIIKVQYFGMYFARNSNGIQMVFSHKKFNLSQLCPVKFRQPLGFVVKVGPYYKKLERDTDLNFKARTHFPGNLMFEKQINCGDFPV